jgi:hypothetical protein
VNPGMKWMCFALAGAAVLGACRGRDADRPAPASVTAPARDATSQAPPALNVPATIAAVPPPIVLTNVAPGTLYVCLTDAGGETRQTAIELPPHVADVCRKAPEMGPCQYEREVCRRKGGRVFAADGAEITRATETEYDKRVMRIRMKSN